MRLTFVCPKCRVTTRREMPSGKGGEPQGGGVRCPKGHGAMVRKDSLTPQTRGGRK